MAKAIYSMNMKIELLHDDNEIVMHKTALDWLSAARHPSLLQICRQYLH